MRAVTWQGHYPSGYPVNPDQKSKARAGELLSRGNVGPCLQANTRRPVSFWPPRWRLAYNVVAPTMSTHGNKADMLNTLANVGFGSKVDIDQPLPNNPDL